MYIFVCVCVCVCVYVLYIHILNTFIRTSLTMNSGGGLQRWLVINIAAVYVGMQVSFGITFVNLERLKRNQE